MGYGQTHCLFFSQTNSTVMFPSGFNSKLITAVTNMKVLKRWWCIARFICPEQQQPRVVASLHGSIHGSYQNSFRICDVDEPESENEIQEIEEDDHAIVPSTVMETPSPFAPTIRVMDQNGSPKILKVILGRVAPGATDSRKLTSRGTHKSTKMALTQAPTYQHTTTLCNITSLSGL